MLLVIEEIGIRCDQNKKRWYSKFHKFKWKTKTINIVDKRGNLILERFLLKKWRKMAQKHRYEKIKESHNWRTVFWTL